METLVPFGVAEPKSRLSPVLPADERAAFARAMLTDTLAAIRGAGGSPRVLATGPVEGVDAPVTVDGRPLTPAVNRALAAAGPDPDSPVAVVVADLPLATPAAVERLYRAGAVGEAADGPARTVAIAPGRGGGTNALAVRHPEFRVDYHGASVRDHRRAARRLDAPVAAVDSYRLGTDVDEPADLPEVLLHADGAAADWLRDAGFALDADDGRVTATRDRG